MARQTRSSATSTPQTTKSTPKKSPRSAANKKSKYFESPSEQEESSFDEDDANDDLSSESEAAPTETDDDEPPKKKSKTTPKKEVNKVTKQKAAPRRTSKATDVESEEEAWETFVPKESTPEVGDVPHKNHTIHPNTMKFLEDLAENNDREWFWSHEKRYRAAEKDFKSFVEELSTRLMDIDPTIPALPLKDIIFRIYRDVRFSNDKTLYKNHFSVAWSRTGRKGPYAAYYFHVQPGHTFISAGKWNPDAGALARIRHVIDRRPTKFKRPLQAPKFKKVFGGLAGLTSATRRHNITPLKTAPKGYAKDHVDIDLLKLRTFHVNMLKDWTNEDVTAEDFIDKCADVLQCVSPFVEMLNSVVMPDDDSSDSDEGEEEEEEED